MHTQNRHTLFSTTKCLYVTHDPYSALGLTEDTVIHVVNELWTVNYVVEINGSDSKNCTKNVMG